MKDPCSCADAVQLKTALVVAPSSDIDELLTSVLTSDSWSIRRAVDNQHALALATTAPFDLIVTGRKMLGPQDVELLHKIRSARAHVRLIILADRFTPGDVISAMREGAFSYFSAPYEAPELAETLRAAMEDSCWDDGIEVLSGTPEWISLSARSCTRHMRMR